MRASKETGLDVNAEETKRVVLLRGQRKGKKSQHNER